MVKVNKFANFSMPTWCSGLLWSLLFFGHAFHSPPSWLFPEPETSFKGETTIFLGSSGRSMHAKFFPWSSPDGEYFYLPHWLEFSVPFQWENNWICDLSQLLLNLRRSFFYSVFYTNVINISWKKGRQEKRGISREKQISWDKLMDVLLMRHLHVISFSFWGVHIHSFVHSIYSALTIL